MTEAVPQLRTNATAVLDWRRQVTAMYAVVKIAVGCPRRTPVLAGTSRNRLLGSHSQSPILPVQQGTVRRRAGGAL